MDKDEIKKKVTEEEDYIRSPKFNNSLAKFLGKNTEGVENSVISRLLLLSEEEIEKLYLESAKTLKENMTSTSSTDELEETVE